MRAEHFLYINRTYLDQLISIRPMRLFLYRDYSIPPCATYSLPNLTHNDKMFTGSYMHEIIGLIHGLAKYRIECVAFEL